MSVSERALVIGGGAVGLCTAFYLRKSGYRVTVVERRHVGSGSSHGNAGLVVPSHSIPLAAPGVVSQGLKWMFDPESPFYIKPRLDMDLLSWLWKFWLSSNEGQVRKAMPLIRDLSYASLSLFDDFASRPDTDFGFHRVGLLDIFETEDAFNKARYEADMLSSNGLSVEILSRNQLCSALPGLDTRSVGAIRHVDDGHLKPQQFVADMATILVADGVEILQDTEVLGFVTDSSSISAIQTTTGEIAADQVVVCAGSWSAPLARLLSVNLPVQPAKGYSITIRRPDMWPEIPFVLAEAKVGVTPMIDTLRFAGTLELAGFDESVSQKRVEAIRKSVNRCLPGMGAWDSEVLEIWRGLRPCTPDGLPFLGRTRAWRNLVIGAGHAMIGISLAPITGRLVTQVVNGEEPEIDISMLNVNRFE